MRQEPVKVKEPQSLLADAVGVLMKHLGPAKTARVWQMLATPYGDYLSIRKELFADKSVDDIYQEARKFNRKK